MLPLLSHTLISLTKNGEEKNEFVVYYLMPREDTIEPPRGRTTNYTMKMLTNDMFVCI
jgi:hypothetical protein